MKWQGGHSLYIHAFRLCFSLTARSITRSSRDTYYFLLFSFFFLQTVINYVCVNGSTNGTKGIPISFKVLLMVPLVIPLVPVVLLVKTVGRQYCRQSTVWAKLPTLESHMIQCGVLNFKFINFTNKHCFYQDDISK